MPKKILSKNAKESLFENNSIDNIYGSDTIRHDELPEKFNIISVSGILQNIILQIYSNNSVSKDNITMNDIRSYIKEKETLEEGIFFHKYDVSVKVDKLANTLEKRKSELEKEIKQETDLEKINEKKEIIKAIKKATPIINDFKKYFQRLEKKINKLPQDEKRKEIELKYEEIRIFFINELYQIMYSVGYRASTVIASAIVSLLLAIVFIPGGGPILFLPTVQLIRKINIARNRITSGAIAKDLDRITKELQSKKRMRFTRFSSL